VEVLQFGKKRVREREEGDEARRRMRRMRVVPRTVNNQEGQNVQQ
jgi:hypothetical protein